MIHPEALGWFCSLDLESEKRPWGKVCRDDTSAVKPTLTSLSHGESFMEQKFPRHFSTGRFRVMQQQQPDV